MAEPQPLVAVLRDALGFIGKPRAEAA